MYLSSGAFGKCNGENKSSNIVIFLPKIDVLILNSHTTLCFAFVRNHVKSLNVQGTLQGGGIREPWKTELSLPPLQKSGSAHALHHMVFKNGP